MNGHPHTVRSSAVPLYMQGFPARHLGQDDGIDTTMIDAGDALTAPDFSSGGGLPFLPQTSDLPNMDPSMFDPGSSLIAPTTLDRNTQDLANMYAGAVASGAITPASAASSTAKAASDLAKAASGATQPFIFSPSPKVATRPPGATSPSTSVFSSQSVIKGVPDIALIGGGALLLIAMMGKR